MTTSNTTSFSMTLNEIINKSFIDLGLYDVGSTVIGDDYNYAVQALNLMIKKWQSPTYGLHLWTEQEGCLFITPGQVKYQIGGSTSDKIGDSAVNTTLSASAASSATSLTVTSTTGMTALDNIGIVLDANTIQWTTISSITDSTHLVINSGLTSAATSGNMVFTYTNTSGRPLDISNVRLVRPTNNSYLMYELTRDRYFRIPLRTTSAPPIQYYVDKQRDYTNLYLYGTDSVCSNCIQFTYKRILQDITSSTNTLDWPQEWLSPIIDNLEVVLASTYGKEFKVGNPQQLGSIANRAMEGLEALRGWDQEQGNLCVTPDLAMWSN